MSATPALGYEVFVSEMAPVATPPRPDNGPSLWSSLSHTLVYGRTEALLTDPPITRAQADTLIGWIDSHDVALRYIYLTHAHFDHFATTNHLLRHFPDATVVASKAVLSRIARQTPGGVLAERYRTFFGDALPEPPVTVQGSVFPAGGLLLDGHELFAHGVGHSDTDDTSVLHVPSLELVVAGDVVYNNVHPYLGEARGGGLDAWHRALDQVAALQPRFVVASHKDTRRGNPASDIDETHRYLDIGAEVLASSTNRADFFHAMKQHSPERVNPWAIWLGALQLFEN
ncbi:MBL fold metallo-hydrolase [Streptomyces apricus]|uniref:MBL fold metallo-hydrolase n=1 Tax=Streptomyces apricus TaxID=1828112 RepID=A0A5A9ZW14_9ACTN|nr:MBL fold metallo-hydrolase [Streptomyces apricus]KAA0921350.1 MBL fold metallo-hydrolase [Streptomyces apricus]